MARGVKGSTGIGRKKTGKKLGARGGNVKGRALSARGAAKQSGVRTGGRVMGDMPSATEIRTLNRNLAKLTGTIEKWQGSFAAPGR